MDPLSAIGSLVGIIDAIFSTYKTIKEIAGLPKAFDEIGKGVPLIQYILRDARERLVEGPDVTDEEANVVEAILTPCHDKLLKLQQIFKQVANAAKKEERSKDWAKIWAAYGKALRGIKAHRVETLMSDIMEGVKKLALSQVFKTVMKKDLAGIEEAITKLSEVDQSLPDSEIETAGTINATQTVATGAYGQQNNTQGGVNTFNHGKFLATGEGQNIHYVDKLYTTITTKYSVKMQYKIVRESVSPWFVGRETLLGDIRETFTKGLNDPFAFQPTVIVFSAGFGQGKTQVALRYSCIRKVYRGVFWISAFSEENVIQDLEAIAVRIKMPLGSTWKAVLEELASWEDPWLMVFNVWADVSKFSTPLASFFPSGRGSVLVVTREKSVRLERPSKMIDVPPMTDGEVAELFRQRCLSLSGTSTFQHDDIEAAKELARLLKYDLPDINHAAEFLSSNGLSPRQGLKMYQEGERMCSHGQGHCDMCSEEPLQEDLKSLYPSLGDIIEEWDFANDFFNVNWRSAGH